MRVRSFQALRPRPDLADRVASVPYDVVNAAEAAALAAGNPYSLLHVSRSEIDLPSGADPYSDAVYARAAEEFHRFQKEGILIRDDAPGLYVYRQIMGDHAQSGVVACCAVEDYERNVIKKHEKTRRDKEDDRTRHIAAVNANTGPVFLAYRDRPEIDAIVAAAEAGPPLYDFVSADRIRHTVWPAPECERLAECFGRVPAAYIADGHHRAAASARVGAERRAANPGHSGAEEYNWFLGVLFPASQLRILPYNRCVADLNGLTVPQLLKAASGAFDVEESATPRPAAPGHVRMYVASQWYGLSWEPKPARSLVDALDVSVLQDRLLAPVLGIGDPRTSPRIAFVGGIRGPEELARLVDSGKAAAAFSMFPVTLDQLMAVSDAGQIMPPKSTWFEPKLRSGLLIHTL